MRLCTIASALILALAVPTALFAQTAASPAESGQAQAIPEPPVLATPSESDTLTPATEPDPAALFPTDPLAFEIATRLAADDSLLIDTLSSEGAGDEHVLGILDFYEARRYQPLWLTLDGLNPFGKALIEAFSKAGDHALNPRDYHGDDLMKLAANSENLPQLEIELSKNYITYASHLMAGRVAPNDVNKALNIFPEAPPPAALLGVVESVEDFSDFLESLAPNTPNYARLKQRLAEYRSKAQQGGFTIMPVGQVLKPGMADDRLDSLRARLAEEDLLAAGSHLGQSFDGALVEAVKLFQERHGLEVDGVIGPDTLAEINVPIEDRIAQMEINMERRRWMPDDLGERYVFVNLADQNLKVVLNDKTIHTARVVVGKPYHATPVFSDQMTYVEINPYWTVPHSIATKEFLPQLKRNPATLQSKDIRVFSGNSEISPYAVSWASYSPSSFPFTLRQEPGNSNALGRIKFMFPNKFNIYIHDTPSKSLFDRSRRDFSHGCIRVNDPFALGGVLLGPDGWTRAKLESARDSKARRIIKLKDPIPVHITYLTAWVNKDGSTHFRPDIYGRDKVLEAALRPHLEP
jgi:murein L,D-transpeptidase YcbB/YkuD